MRYSDLVEVYDKLEKHSGRLNKTYYISKLLEKTDTDDLEKVILLLQGKLFPTYDERKIGIAERIVIKALAVATGKSSKEIEQKWKKIGDIGEVAKESIHGKSQSTLFSKSLTVSMVFENLRKLSQLQGSGTIDKKIGLIAELLTSASSNEAKYIIRTLLEDLRIGVGEGSLRDAIVWAFFPKVIGIFYKCSNCHEYNPNVDKCINCGNKIENKFDKEIQIVKEHEVLHAESIEDLKNLKKYKFILAKEEKIAREIYNHLINIIQEAYDKKNDFSEVAKLAKKYDIKEITTVDIEPLKPIKVMLYQKAKDLEDAFNTVGKPAAIEFKYDGFRCITGHTLIYTLNKGLISVKDIKVNDLVLTHKGNFKHVSALNKRKIDKKEKLFLLQTFLGNKFKITEKHRILAKEGNKIKWVNSEKLTKNHYLIFPIPKINIRSQLNNKLILEDSSGYKKTITIDKDFFRFLGYWVGDGFTNNYHNTERIGLIFNEKTGKKLCSLYEKIIKTNLKIKNISKNIHNGAIYLYWRDKPFRIWLSKNFRKEWKGKFIPNWFFGINKKQFLNFMEGWIESDGYKDKLERISITTKEREIAMITQLIALKFGIVYGVKKLRINNKTYFKIIITKTHKHYKINKNYVEIKLLNVKEIKRPDPRINLYNLQIKDDESYCTTLVSLHNCQIHKKGDDVKIFTRRLENVTNQFPDIVSFIKSHVKGNSFIIDAEAVGYDKSTLAYLPFQNISQRIKRKYNVESMARDYPVEINVFDIIYYNGNSQLKIPFEERRALLKKIIKQSSKKIILAKQIITSDLKKAQQFYEESLKAGEEGIMAKKLDGIYKPGSRVGYGVKVKPETETLDLVIVGAEWGTGKRAHWLSSFTVACRDKDNFLEIGKVGTGIKEKTEGITFGKLTKMLKPLIQEEKGKEVAIKPKIIIEIGYSEIQKSPTYDSGFALRFPRLLKLRLDRSEGNASTLDYIKKLYQQQKK